MTKAFQLTPRQPAAKAAATQGIVAIVDDDPEISLALSLWFELHGLSSMSYASSESLLQAIRHENGRLTMHAGAGNPAVLPLLGAVLDINLPGLTGIELVQLLRGMAPDLPLVIMTAMRDEERLRYGNPPMGIHCLKKPFDLDALQDALFPLLH